jgi:hypothetical protein
LENDRSKAPARSRPALNRVDYLVLAATILTFLAVVAGTDPHAARAHANGTIVLPDLPDQAIQHPFDPALIGARIKLATGQL